MVRLTYPKKQAQALSFVTYLHTAGYQSVFITTEELSDLFLEGFKPQHLRENPNDPVIPLSQVRYLLIQKGWLVKRDGKLLVVDGSPVPRKRQLAFAKSKHHRTGQAGNGEVGRHNTKAGNNWAARDITSGEDEKMSIPEDDRGYSRNGQRTTDNRRRRQRNRSRGALPQDTNNNGNTLIRQRANNTNVEPARRYGSAGNHVMGARSAYPPRAGSIFYDTVRRAGDRTGAARYYTPSPAPDDKTEVAVKARPSASAESTESQASRSGRSGKKVAQLAVDQHMVLHQLEKSALKSPRSPEQRPASQPPEEDDNQIIEHENSRSLTFDGKRYICDLCKTRVSGSFEASKHVSGRKHRSRALLYSLKFNKAALAQDKHSISISCQQQADDGTICTTVHENEPLIVPITITNNKEHDTAVLFKRCDLLKKVRVFQLSDQHSVSDGTGEVVLKPGATYTVEVTILASFIGAFSTVALFAFAPADSDSDSNADDFYIVRFLSTSCSSRLVDDLAPESPYLPPPRCSAKAIDVEVIEGFPLPRNTREQLESEIELEQHRVPPLVRRLVNRGMVIDKYWSDEDKECASNILDVFYGELTPDDHWQRFATLLHVEEIQMEVDIRKYDMDAVSMQKCTWNPRLLTLKVPGLAEKRPSVLKGDCLYVRMLGSGGKPSGAEFKGYVHDVGQDEVYLGFSHQLQSIFVKNMRFSVRFTFGRLPIRVQQRAVLLAEENSLDKMLFPTLDTACTFGLVPAEDIRFFDQRVEANKEQKQAVLHILQGSSRPAPYLIFGPPGTGKTVTIVEAIKQVVRRVSSSHILVCAPSNSAADLLCSRLLAHLEKTEILRMNAISRGWRDIPDTVKSCSNYDKYEQKYFFPSKADIQKYRIVICTLVTAARLVSANFPAGHFTHVFIDEAGHAAEPEALIPVAGVLECDLDPEERLNPAAGSQLVLAGDPQQLGPVLRSPIAIGQHLDMSFLERLMKHSVVYQRGQDGTFDSRLLTKLVRNYRSHPSILALPNKYFYDDELQTHADQQLREALCKWDMLPTAGFPLLFHGSTAIEQREARSPSFFNAVEVTIVIQYVQHLLTSRSTGVHIEGRHIGIISPYRKQVQKIKKALAMKNLPSDIKVGSVEEFQGQERLIIIISTVRTSPEYLGMDLEYKLGFLKNPKRFNVSVTRAKALLIVVGNPYILSKDFHWNKLLEYCRQHGAYRGVEYEPEEEQIEDLISQFSTLKLTSILGEAFKDLNLTSLKNLVEDPEWRGDH